MNAFVRECVWQVLGCVASLALAWALVVAVFCLG